MPRPAAAPHSLEELRRKMKILLAGLCWALAASVITLAVFGSYFKASSGATFRIARRTRWWHSRQAVEHQDGLLRRQWLRCCGTAPEISTHCSAGPGCADLWLCQTWLLTISLIPLSGELQKQATQLSMSLTPGLHLSPPSSSFLSASQDRRGLALVFSPEG